MNDRLTLIYFLSKKLERITTKLGLSYNKKMEQSLVVVSR